MSIEDIAKTMASRMPWDTAKRVFDSGEIEKSHGWDNTVRKLADENADDEEAAAYLSGALSHHILCGEKLSRFYKLSKVDMDALRVAALDLQPKNTEFRKAYPSNISDELIEETFPQKHTLAAVEKNDDGVGLVFASTRAVEMRQPIELDILPEDAAELLEGFSEVVGIKLIKFQAMDVVWIPHKGSFVDVRVDFPRGMHLDTGSAAHEATTTTLAKLIQTDYLASPANLFPLIKKIYEAPKEGSIVELAFGTTTASLKHEKMRRGGKDLRNEKYHQGGKSALNTPIEPYRLSVRWDFDLEADVVSHPELSLNGNSRMNSSATRTIQDINIRGCVGVADYEFVRERIEHYMTQKV